MTKFLVMIINLMLLTAAPAQAKEAADSAAFKNAVLGFAEPDARVERLAKFLASYDSPLTPYAPDFVAAADQYGLDWQLVPAITGVESTFGKHIPGNSYNAYGWANGAYRFTSWPQSIDHVTRVLAEKYVGRGLDTPGKIGPVYAPPSSTWAVKVAFFINQLDNLKALELTL